MKKRHKFTMVAFILGVVSLAVPFVMFTPVPIVAIVLGVIAMRQTKKEELPGMGLALTGVICGDLGSIGMLLIFFIFGINIFFSLISGSFA